MDWALVNFGSMPISGPETAVMINRFLALNPKLKIIVRVWPVNNLGGPDSRHLATFLNYLYKPGVKEKLLEKTSRQIRSILDGVSKPQNVVGFAFMEELPYHFGMFGLDVSNPEKLPREVERYKQEIEADLEAGYVTPAGIEKDYRWS